jgi:type III secretory pathway component EscR
LELLAMSGGFDRGIVMLVAAPIAIFIIAMIGMVFKIGLLKLLAFVVVSLIFCIIMGKKRSSY